MAKVSTKGYKKNSKDKNEPYLQIPSGMITMKEDDGTPLKKGPILGIDNLGNQQLMIPGADYQFPGNSVYEIPMAKMGGSKKVRIHSLPKAQDGREWQAPRIVEFGPSRMNPATFQDSIDVGNASQKAMDWYMANGYFNLNPSNFINPKDPQINIFPENPAEWKPIKNDGPAVDQRIHIGGKNKIGADDLGQGGLQWTNPDITFTIPAGVNQVIQDGFSGIGDLLGQGIAGTANLVKGEQLAQWLNHNQFLQYGDEHQRIVNTDAPRILYDTRIQPRTKFALQGTAPGYFSGNADLVDLPTYEKWYTTPWSLLSDEDKRKRLEFGILDGTPFKDWNDPGLIQNYPDIALANGGRRAQGYDEQTIKNAAASGYAPTQEGAAQYEKNKWAKNPRVYDAQTIANAVKSGYPATQSGAAEYELNNWQKKPNSKNSIARKEPNPNTDIAHYMKTELGLDKKQTSYSERKKLAEKYGIKDYSGSAKQNIELLNKIKSEEDPADAVRRMLAGEKLNTVLPTDSQPEDFKVPYKGDPNRRSYPIELSGDAAIDNMRQQLFGNLGKFTDNGKIPLDDPKYNPYVGGIGPRTPEQEMKRIAIPPGGFAYGGQIPMAQMGMGMAPPPPPRPAPMKYLPMKELGLLQMPGIDIKPQLQNIPSIELPQITKQRVVVNTAQGDKIRVQDPKTKKFMWWEDQKGLPSDIENPTGVASQDFQFAYGGQLPKAQRGLGTILNRTQRILNRTQRDVIYNDLDEYNKANQAEGDSLLAATNTYLLLDHLNQVQRGHRFFDGLLGQSVWRNDPASKLYYNSLQNKYIKPTSNRLVNVTPNSSNVSGVFPVNYYDFPETHAVYQELPKPVMKEPTPFPIPTLGIKPQLQNIERPKSNKQRVLINTPQGDKVRVQDIRTKKFIDWEETDGAPVDIENPTGTASQDFVYPEPKVIKTPKFTNGGDISVPDLRRVKIDSLPKAQKGGEPTYVYSKNDPAYKKYLQQKAYYDKQKAIYQDIGERAYYTTYDELVEQAYKNAAAYNTPFDPNVGLTYSNNDGGYAFRKPTPVILEKESNHEAIDIKPLPMQQVDLKPQLKNASIPLPARKHPVIKSTGDAALDKLNQELYGPSGEYFATGGELPKAQKGEGVPYAYYNPQLNKWQDAPKDPNQFIPWDQYMPATELKGFEFVGKRMTDAEDKDYQRRINTAQLLGPEFQKQNPSNAPVASDEEIKAFDKKVNAKYWEDNLKALEEERKRLMQEFVDQQNSSKSPLQKSFGDLSLENPATRAAARNYADYKLGLSNPKNMLDRMFTGSSEVGLRDFYRPHDASMTLTVPAVAAAAAAAPVVAEGAVAALPEIYAAALPYAQALGAGTRQLLSAAPKAVPWLNAGNALTYGFGVKGANAIATGQVAEPWRYANSTGRPMDYADAVAENLMTALEIAPFAGAAIKTGVEAIKPITSAFMESYNTRRALAQIQNEGLQAGLTDFEIAHRQLAEVGITSNQRQGYKPIVSELANQYLTPIGYSGSGPAQNKIQQTIGNITGGGWKNNLRTQMNKATWDERLPEIQIRSDAWRTYLGMPQQHGTFTMANTAPTMHAAYPPGSLKGMDIYNIPEDKIFAGVVDKMSRGLTGTGSSKFSEVMEPLDKAITLHRENYLMGGYNQRLTQNGLEYNDIWDVEPFIKFSDFVPKKIHRLLPTKVQDKLFVKTIPTGTTNPYLPQTMETPRGFTVKLDKFIGKPFMSHGLLDYTSTQHASNVRKRLLSEIGDFNNSTKYWDDTKGSVQMRELTPKQVKYLSDLQNKLRDLYGPTYPKQKKGGETKRVKINTLPNNWKTK